MSDPPVESDAELLGRTAAGESAAFDRFVERHQAAVLRFARSLESDPVQAEDALQETFLAAWRGAGGFRGGEGARPWLFAIARHAVYRQHRPRVGEPAELAPLTDLGVAAGWGAAPETDPVVRLADRDAVRRALARLPAPDREILLLREVEGFTAEECTGQLGLTLPAVKSRLHRARLRFAAALRGDHHGE